MEVFALSPPVSAFLSRHSPLSVASATSLPAGDRKSQGVTRVPASSGTKRFHVSGPGESRSSRSSSLDVTKSDGKRRPATPVKSSRQAAVAEVIQSPDWVSALSRFPSLSLTPRTSYFICRLNVIIN